MAADKPLATAQRRVTTLYSMRNTPQGSKNWRLLETFLLALSDEHDDEAPTSLRLTI